MSRSKLRGAYTLGLDSKETERYIAGASPSFVQILENELPYFSYYEALRFYSLYLPHLNRNELALLNCNDRFFLVTGTLNRKDALHPWLYDRAREIEEEPDGYLDLWARYHYKSTFITFAGSIQEILCDPETAICIFSNNIKIASPFLEQIKQELESNVDLKATHPDVLWQDARERKAANATWSNTGITVKRRGNPKECTVEAHGLIDALPTGKHFPILTYDDVITEKNVTNPDQIKKAVERTELSFPIGIGEKTRKRFVGTRYSYADAYGYLIEKKIAKPRLYPATDNGKLDGKPVFLTRSAWVKVMNEQRSNVAAQMLQNPIAGKENTFFTKWLRPYWVMPLTMNIYIMGDPSLGKSASSDRTAMAVVGIDTANNKYLLDGYCHRMKLAETWKNFSQLYWKWKNMPCTQSISVGYERYGMQRDLEYFEEQMRLTGRHFAIEELNWVNDAGGQSKAKRVGRLEPDFRNSHFYLPGKIYHPDMRLRTGSELDELGTIVPAKWMILDPENDEHAQLLKDTGGEEFYYQPLARHDNGRIVSLVHPDERRARASGENWRVVDSIRRIDEDDNIYDLTRIFFEEYRFFPFSPHDDLIDAVSRLYDLTPMPARRFEHVAEADYPDA
jgi:hypothetical protein